MVSLSVCVYVGVACLCLWLVILLYGTIVSLVFPQRDIKKRYGHGRYAVVTGASCGIGLEVVRRLRKQHVPVCAVCLDDSNANTLENELKNEENPEESPSIVLRADLSSADGVNIVCQSTDNLDVGFCVLCAGCGYARELEHVGNDTEWMEHYLHTNITQTIILASHFYHRWVSSNTKGGLVLMSSAMALMPASHCELYCASKSALASFVYSLTPSARSHNIDILALSPGAVLGTHFFDNVPKTHSKDAKDSQKEERMVSLLYLVMLAGQSVDSLVNAMFRSIGRWGVSIVDTGLLGVAIRIATQLFGPNFVATAIYIVVWGTHSLFGWFDDYINLPPLKKEQKRE